MIFAPLSASPRQPASSNRLRPSARNLPPGNLPSQAANYAFRGSVCHTLVDTAPFPGADSVRLRRSGFAYERSQRKNAATGAFAHSIGAADRGSL